jgi:hypothetical protein
MRKQKPQQSLFYKLARNTFEAVGSPFASLALASLFAERLPQQKENRSSHNYHYLGSNGAIFQVFGYMGVSYQY